MRISIFAWIIIFIVGALVGDRYGTPKWASNVADRGFVAIEGWFGKLDEPIPAAEEADAGEDDDTDEPPAESDPASSNDDDDQKLRINAAGLQIIKESEGLRLEAYNLNGQWLIGYGHARTAQAGMTITEAQAEELLREDIASTESAVRWMVEVPVNANQFSALVSLAYNLGAGGFSKTSVLEKLNDGEYQNAAEAFLSHDRARINGELQSIPHLTERRQKEHDLFLQEV